MSKKMTPCEKLGYKAGDKFELVEKSYKFDAGDVVYLQDDDGTGSPYFTNESVKDEYPLGVSCFLSSIKKVAKLKPAKQALADAIHQSGGWLIAGDYNYVASNHRGVVKFFHEKPLRNGVNWVGGSCSLAWVDLHQQLPNWHQCVLSREEYFTAYPEQVKVDVINETKRKVEVEMKSEPKITIKASDWHKNGELPPVGDVVEFVRTGDVGWHKQLNTGTNVTILAHYSPCNDGEMVAVFCHKVCDDHEEGRLVDQGVSICFRPLRTDREKAIDEMINVGGLRAMDGAREVFGRIYDSGMYREVK